MSENHLIKQQGSIKVRGINHYYEWIRQPLNSHQKPIMVFIHGWGGSARYWERIATSLSDHFDCFLYDLRGFGRSNLLETNQTLTYELEDYARDLAELLDVLGIEKIYLHSHSMGASIAVLFANLYPQKIEKSILACNGIFEYDPKAFAAFHQFGGYVVKFRYHWFLKIPFAAQMFMARFLNQSIDYNLKRLFLEDFLNANYEAALGTIYTSVSQKAVEIMPKQFAQIKIPTLLISGEKDQIIPAAMGKKAADLSDNLQYIEIPRTGHFPMLEDQETYLASIQKFLELDSEK
jgi:pimeloyl-ACP methyl ester carboxylesterase